MILAGTCTSGIGLIMAAPWLFWTGVEAVVVGIILGRATHAMRDEWCRCLMRRRANPTAEYFRRGFRVDVRPHCLRARTSRVGRGAVNAPSSPRRGRASQSITNCH